MELKSQVSTMNASVFPLTAIIFVSIYNNSMDGLKTWDDVDFHTFGSFHKRLCPAMRVYHLKLVHDLLPLDTRRYREAPTKDEQL